MGSSLTPLGPNTSWLSPSGKFAFGFRPLPSDTSKFLLAVWFEKIADRTIVWYVNGDDPVQDGAKVELTSDGRFSLEDHSGSEVWSAGVSNASHAAMLNTGNFVLVDAEGQPRWQSFQIPADTVLPKNVDVQNEDDSVLVFWANDDCFRYGRLDMLVEGDEQAMRDMKKVERFVRVSLWCIQEDPSLRPTMQKVTQMLDGASPVPVPPDPSSYISSL
ncbi:hypothetical protein ZIOFF_068547 [Zingiber officinale]|uniref:Bulb-type lectin domain-containing protein n=1 Tax=Zingiber officinale TaxID=94328 RepID=A0A8J5CH61_ZINOF|nr:hypothetical protein ZIOFF_068547 [Zingiber officinale]